MTQLVNLNRVRKRVARAEQDKQAEANRAKFGRSRAEREAEAARAKRASDVLDQHRIQDGAAS